MVFSKFIKSLFGIKENLILTLVNEFNRDYGQIESQDFSSLEINRLRSLWNQYYKLINKLKKTNKESDIYPHLLVFETAMMKIFADVTILTYVGSFKQVQNINSISKHCEDLAKLIIKGLSEKNNLVSLDKILRINNKPYSNPFLRDGHISKSLNSEDKPKLNQINVILEILKKKLNKK